MEATQEDATTTPFNIHKKRNDQLSPNSNKSVLQKQVCGHWCFNCYHFVSADDIFVNKKHRVYLFEKFDQMEAPKDEYLVCICLDCVYYRLQKCSCCLTGRPLCMYPMTEWFEEMPQKRKCIDCTALSETKDVLQTIGNLHANQCILQCNKCSQYKFVCSFSVFSNAYGMKARRVVRDLDMKKDQKLYKRSICLQCRLNEDINLYRKSLKERYLSKISDEPQLSAEMVITANPDKGDEFFGPLSYANAVVGLNESELSIPVPQKEDISDVINRCLFEEEQSGFQGPAFILSSMHDFVCDTLLKILQDEIIALRYKTELELQLSELPTHIWDEVLLKKMQFTTHMFSLQADGASNFVNPESRWAYTGIYTPVHASIVYDIVSMGKFKPLLNLIADANTSDENFHVACFGSGPGSEVLGLNPYLPSNTHYHLLDNCSFWEHNAKKLMEKGLGVEFDFTHFDAQKKVRKEHYEIAKKSKLFTFVKFLSAIQDQHYAASSIESIFDCAPSGSVFLVIDNSQPQVKRYIEDIVFPQKDYTTKDNCKENDKFSMYTSYGEYRFDVADAMQKQLGVYNLVSLVMEWVDRPPLVDIRIFTFVIVKK